MRISPPPEQSFDEPHSSRAGRHGKRAHRNRQSVDGRSLDHRHQRREVRSEQSRFYKQLTPAYEMLFPLLVRRRIWDSIKKLQLAPGAKVLEVGVGTGTSLPAYPSHVSVTGIDLSEEMLAYARRKIEQESWNHIQVTTGNAESLDFPDASFDCVTTFHVVSVVSQPDRMMAEIVRVVRPGGKILVINHFRSPRPWLANVIDRADPVTRHLGWRTDLAIDSIVQSLPVRIDRCYKTSPLSLFTVLSATRLE